MRLQRITDVSHPIRYELRRLDVPLSDSSKAVETISATSHNDAVKKSDPVEWVQRKAIVAGVRDFEAGDLEVLAEGCLRINLSPTAHIKLSPHEYSGPIPLITVPQKIIDDMDQSRMATKVQSIIAGELTLWP
jgi:hypothetical protein